MKKNEKIEFMQTYSYFKNELFKLEQELINIKESIELKDIESFKIYFKNINKLMKSFNNKINNYIKKIQTDYNNISKINNKINILDNLNKIKFYIDKIKNSIEVMKSFIRLSKEYKVVENFKSDLKKEFGNLKDYTMIIKELLIDTGEKMALLEIDKLENKYKENINNKLNKKQQIKPF